MGREDRALMVLANTHFYECHVETVKNELGEYEGCDKCDAVRAFDSAMREVRSVFGEEVVP